MIIPGQDRDADNRNNACTVGEVRELLSQLHTSIGSVGPFLFCTQRPGSETRARNTPRSKICVNILFCYPVTVLI